MSRSIFFVDETRSFSDNWAFRVMVDSYKVWPMSATFEVADWNKRTVQAAQSRGGVVALADFSENLVRVDNLPWPPPAIVQKLFRSIHETTAFSEEARSLLTSKLGFYTNLQSLHSEDAITWSFFGPLIAAPAVVRTDFLNWLLRHLGLQANEKGCGIEIWRRIPHPDNRGMGGPEIDFLIQGSNTVLVGEAKWRSGEGTGQGVNRDKSQLQLRSEFCSDLAHAIFGNLKFLVLEIYWKSPLGTTFSCDTNAILRSISWEELTTWSEHPRASEFRLYFEWKQRWSRL